VFSSTFYEPIHNGHFCGRSAKVRGFVQESDPSDPQAVRVRIPLSLGARRNDLDKGGDPCVVYDVVFNTEVIEQVAALPTAACFSSFHCAFRSSDAWTYQHGSVG
jgi:hypothetical protein